MKTVLLFLVLTLPLAAFPVPKRAAPSVLGIWSVVAKYNDGGTFKYHLTFEDNGVLRYHDKLNGPVSSNGTWEQDGEAVKWVINNYTFCEGTYNGDTFTGTGRDTDKRLSDAILTKVTKD